jgi:hypothetical protein
MKKVLITMAVLTGMVAGAMAFSSFAAPRQNKSTEITMAVPTDGPGTCVQVGNCTVSITRNSDGQTYTVKAINYNMYTVTVSWSAYCNNNKVGGGTLTLAADKGSQSATVYYSKEGVYLDDVSVYKCD